MPLPGIGAKGADKILEMREAKGDLELCCLSFNLRIMITPFVLSLLTIVLSLLQFTDYDYPICPFSFDYCVVSPSIYGL